MGESVHDKLQRVRKPRVHLRLDVHTDGAMEVNELPFVVGVMGDFAGNNSTNELGTLRNRKFTEINRDTFTQIMQRIKPGLSLKVENTLKGDGSQMGVNLKFDSMESFEPGNVAKQIEPLKQLLETRQKLSALLTTMNLGPKLETTLEEILKNTDQTKQLLDEVNKQNPPEQP